MATSRKTPLPMCLFLALAIGLCCVSHAQVVGGSGPGQQMPSAASKASLDAGPVGDNVNLFTGTLSLSHSFGNVATLSGLSFPLELAYEGSVQLSYDPEHSSGIPYGEGWTLANASMTVEDYAFDWTQADGLPHDQDLGTSYTLGNVKRRGQPYFANPRLQLPGGGGGRLVYKWPDPANPSVAVYHLDGFDSYIEARFDGWRWIARTDDGTEWVFGLAQVRERNPVQATAHLASNGVSPTMPKAEVARWHLTEIRNMNHANGQRIVLDYLQFGLIDMRPELMQYGVQDYIRRTQELIATHVWTQQEIDSLFIASGHWPMHGPGDSIWAGDTTEVLGDTARRAVCYRDVLLSSVTALDAQGLQQSRAELKYHSWRPEAELSANALGKGRFLLLSDPQVVRRDSLYSQKTIWFRGTDDTISWNFHGLARPPIPNPQQFEGAWRRIMHPRAYQNVLSLGNPSLQQPFAIDPRNPYKVQIAGVPNVIQGWYMARQWALGSQTATRGSIPFTHSVLESPRLDLREMPSGEIYELRSLVKPPDPNDPSHDMNIDFRVVTGLSQNRAMFGGASHCPHIQMGSLDLQLTPDQLQGQLGYWENGHVVHSTTRDIVKWNPAYGNFGGFLVTTVPFHMPNLPNEFGGINVQVGPGSSNLNHGSVDASGNGYPAFYSGRNNFNQPRDSFELLFGGFFGTGAPLEPLRRTDRYGVECDKLQWAKGRNFERNQWWHLDNDQSYNRIQLGQQGPSQPTAVTIERLRNNLGNSYSFDVGTMAQAHDTPLDAELWNIELVRIGRNPWMLDSVILYGPDHYGTGNGKGVAVAAWKLDYGVAFAPIPNNINPSAQAAVVDWTKPYRMIGADTLFRNVFRLESVRRLDVDSVGTVSATWSAGGLSTFGYMADNIATPGVFEGVLLREVRDNLGGKTTYTYDMAQTKRDSVNRNPVGLASDRSADVVGKGTVAELRVPIVSKSIEGPSGPIVTSYEFLEEVKLYRGFAIDGHFNRGWNSFPAANRVWGFAKAIVWKPTLGGNQRARTEYRYRKATSTHADKLLFGRLVEVREYDASGALVGRRQMDYAATPAYRNGQHYIEPPMLGHGMEVHTEANGSMSYEQIFLWDSIPKRQLMESWFTRLVREVAVDRDPVTGDSVVHVTKHTHFDWDLQQGDPDGDYTEMHRPLLQQPQPQVWLQQDSMVSGLPGNLSFNYPSEPSWQLASSRNSTSAMPGAFTLSNNYYLWDIEPFITSQSVLANRHIGSMRPFWLARRHGVRNAAYEKKVTTYNGERRGKPVALSTWYEWDVFRDVAGDFVMDVDSSNYGRLCDNGSGGPMDPNRHMVVSCVTAGKGEAAGKEVVSEALDNPLLVQLTDSSWWRFPVAWFGAIDLGQYNAMAERSADTLAAVTGCAGGIVNGPDGKVKWFGSVDAGGTMIPVTDFLPVARNYGYETGPDTLTEPSRDKAAILVFKPHTHGESRCDTVHGFACDSSMNAAVANDMAAVRGGGGGDSIQRQNFIDWLDWQFSLRAIYQQVDTVANVWLSDSIHNPDWPSPHNVWDTINTQNNWQSTPYRYVFRPGYPTICTYRVHERNMLGQVVDESDARHLHTVIEYAKGQYRYWFDSCGTAHSSILRPWYGLPLSVTVTDFEAVEQVTRFQYQANQVLCKVVSPNGEVAAMAYDGRHRLIEAQLNGVWRSRNVYGGWDGQTGTSWNARTGDNFVESRNRIDGNRQVFARSYSDPMGRGVQSFIAVKDVGALGGDWHKRFAGKSQLDNWSRIVGQGKNYDKNNQPNLNYDPAVPGSPAATMAYEASVKSRMLRSAKPGNTINGTHVAVNSYRIIKVQQFIQETGATQQEVYALWPGLRPTGNSQPSPSVIRIYKTVATDEDGRQAVNYSDAAGREIASLRYGELGSTNPQSRVLTLFARDAQGRVSRVIHPDKLETHTSHNLLGWPYLVSTPDGGTVRMMYNQAGDLRVTQDANLKAKGRFGCSHVDRMGRVFRQTEAQLGLVGIGNQTYFPLVYKDTLGIPFRSIHTIVDELEHVGNNPTDANAALHPWAWHYLERSFPKLDFPELNGKLVSETRFDFPLDSNVQHLFVPTVSQSLLHPQVAASVVGFGGRTTGRSAVQKVFGDAGELLELSFADYDTEGRLVLLIKQFNPDGISAGNFGDANAISYPSYNLNGSVKQQDVDLGCDGSADFSQLYEYDKWGRLETVFVRHRRGTDRVAKYFYDDGLGLLRGVVHFAAADSTGNCPIISLPADTIFYSHDQQDRMTGIGSRFLDYGLAYDATNINYLGGGNPNGAAVVRTSQNWGGGINGWRANYKVAAEGVQGFNGATVYGFQYDGLHRLVAADASVMEQPFIGPNGWNNAGGFGVPIIQTRPAWFGDEKYSYDKVGNLTGLRRYRYYAPGSPTPGLVGDNWTYRYTQGTNRLEQLRTVANPSINFTYDENGNVISDSKKGITVTQMGRNNLPTEMTVNGTAVKYRYGAGGRTFKRVSGVGGFSIEYYLRDEAGRPLAVNSVLDSTWTFQIYGLDLIGEMDLKAQGDSVAREAADSTIAALQVMTPPKPTFPRLLRDVMLGTALGLQQALAKQNGNEQRPRVVEMLNRFVVPFAVVAVDALVDVLSPRTEPPLPPSPERTSSPDTASYPAVKFFVKDHLGNVRVAYSASIDDTTCLVQHDVVVVMDYSPYGGLLRSWFGGDPERWQSTGHERDYESGWDFRGARLYDASYGRFLSCDPLAGRYPSMSPYNYVMGNPVSLTDPDGRCPDCPDGNYTIQEGDNFWDLENKWGMEHGSLSSLNPGVDPRKLRKGQNIRAAMDMPVNEAFSYETSMTVMKSRRVEVQSNTIYYPLIALGALVVDDVAAPGIGWVDDVGILPTLGWLAAAWVYDEVLPHYETIEEAVEVTMHPQASFYYATYTKTNKDNGFIYVGRTSGYGDPYSIVRARDNGHHMNPEFGPANLDFSLPAVNQTGYGDRLNDPSYWAIRGREQLLIEQYRSLGISGNTRNGIGPQNKKFDQYMNEIRKYFD